MFEWLKYKERLAKVRTELVGIERDCKYTVEWEAGDDNAGQTPPDDHTRRLARSVERIVGILIRIIDSLPG